jgi:hypothetical protein
MVSDWVQDARERLLGLRRPGTGWADQAETSARVEPTALACLGLLASDPGGTHGLEVVRSSSAWLTSVQNADGSLGVSQDLAAPNWGTPHAIWLWTALGSEPDRTGRAVRWLLDQKGEALEPSSDVPTGHDPTIVGWPWVGQTHSWLEPTAQAVLALRCAGQLKHPRTQEGLRLIRDRSIPGGGWNYGNKAVFERELRPQPAPTGLALVALAGLDDRSGREDRALGYLRRVLPGTRSAQSLAWGLLALKAWGQWPDEAALWLSEAYQRIESMKGPATRLAYLLLAHGDRSLSMLGVAGKEAAHHG